MDTFGFSRFLTELEMKGKKPTFIIGGSHGVSKNLYSSVNFRLSLSSLTFPHQFAKLFLLEQIYRSCTIAKNIPYHH